MTSRPDDRSLESRNDIAVLAIDPFDEAFLANPYAYHDLLRDAGPVVWLEALGCYAMARFEEVQAALRDHAGFASGRGVGLADFGHETPWRPPSLLLEADPPIHDRTRGLMNRIVNLVDLKSRREDWTRKADALVALLAERRQFDAVEDLSEAFPMAVFPDMIGVPTEGREALLPYARATSNAFGPRNAVFEEGDREAASALDWIAQACKRQNLSSDGWGAKVYAAADDGLCTEEEAERLVRSFLSAGVDTTVNGIGHLMLAFATHPEEWKKLRDNPTLIKRAFEESLRWDSTVQTFFRTTTRSIEIGGTIIPENKKVLLFLAAANRDPRKWDRPEDFMIERSASGHVGFGFGIHQCLGQMVARQEAEVIFQILVERFKTIRLSGPPVRRLNNTLHALRSMPVEVELA